MVFVDKKAQLMHGNRHGEETEGQKGDENQLKVG